MDTPEAFARLSAHYRAETARDTAVSSFLAALGAVRERVDDVVSFNATRITERLIVGGGIAGPDEIAWLVSQGVTHLLSVAAELDDLSLARDAGLSCKHIAWPDDGQAKPTADFLAAYDWLSHEDALRSASGRQVGLYVHCAAGVNRGPLMATFLLAALSGLPPATVWTTFVKAQRTQAAGYDNPTYRQSCDDAYHALHALGPATPLAADAAQSEVPDAEQAAEAEAAASTRSAKGKAVGITDGASGTTA